MNRQFSQLGRQLVAIWKQLGLNQRISIALATLIVFAGLVSLALWSGRVDYALLYGRLDDTEAAKVVNALDEAKVPHKAGAGGAIYVPRDKVHTMRMQLAAKGIPRGEGGVGFEIFDKPNFGISDFVQRANYIRALQGELARTIGQLDEVDSARVMIVMPENRLLLDNDKRATASVFVNTKGHVQLQPSAVNSIRFLVANAVEGLQPNQVTVVDNRGNVLSENTDPDSLAGLTASQLSARRSLEQYLSKKAEGMLEAVLGPRQAVVRVAAEINFDQLTRTEEKFDPDGQVLRSTTVNDENVESTGTSAGGGAPGVASNLGDTNTTTAAAPAGNRTKKKVTNSQYELNKITSNMTQLAGGLKRVSAAVFVASRYDGAGTARKAVPRSKEELDKLRRIVQSALGAQIGADGTGRDEITLEETSFNDPGADVGQNVGGFEKRQFWWQQVQTFIYPALGLAVLFVFYRALKRTPIENLPAGTMPGLAAGTASSGNGSRGGLQSIPAPSPPGTITPEVFNQLARENPENLGQAIQNWLGRSASVGAPGNAPVKQP